LATNTWCRELRLDCFYFVGFIGDKGAEALAHALEENKHLQRLNLRGNRIGDPGATALGTPSILSLFSLGTPSMRALSLGTISLAAFCCAFSLLVVLRG
jgi:hypothetical protein